MRLSKAIPYQRAISRQSLRYTLLALSIGFLVVLAFHARHEISTYFGVTNWLLFVVSVLVGTAGYIVSGTYFQVLLKKHDEPVDQATSRKLLLYSQIIKYIPGKVWSLIYQASMLNGVKSTGSVTLSNLDFMVISIIMVISVSLGILTLNLMDEPVLAIVIIFVGAIGFISIAKSCALSNVAHYVVSALQKDKSIQSTCISPKENVKTIVYFIFFASTYAASHMLMLNAVFGFGVEKSSLYLAYLGLAWIVGALSMVIPGGIGVKEAVFVLLAQSAIEAPEMGELISVAVVSRLWTIVQEGMGVTWALAESRCLRT